MTLTLMILCSLFISFLAMVALITSEIYIVKNNDHCRVNITHILAGVFLCCVPILNVTFLIGSCCVLAKEYLDDKGIIESVNEYLTNLIKGA